MQFEIRKATRKKAKLRMGIAAPSGAGKTLGSLLLAYGIVGDWSKIGVIDTEEGSGELYVGRESEGLVIGDYLYGRISAPFDPKKYTDAITAMEGAGAEVIIIDSLTHAWSGVGGLLEKQGRLADKSGNSYTAWRTITPEHNALVNAILQSKSHIIATMRSKVEYVMQKGDDGKYSIQKMGMAPVQREGMEYEFTVFLDIDSNHFASASKDRTDLFQSTNAAGAVEKRQFVIKPDVGQRLKQWLDSGVDYVPEEHVLADEIGALLQTTDLPDDDKQLAFIKENIASLRAMEKERLQKMKQFLIDNQRKD